jgi:DNA replication protein DnaC
MPPIPCPDCGGAGVYVIEVTDHPEHPLNGQMIYCTCEAGRQLAAERVAFLHGRKNLPDRLAGMTLDTFAALPDLSAQQTAALAMARQLVETGQVESRGHPRAGLFLWGDVGVGKSGLAAGIVNGVVAHGIAAYYTTVPDLLDYLRSTFGPTSEVSYDDLFERLRTVRLLVLDDLGTESPTTWAVEKLYQIVDHRYGANAVTVVTANRSSDDLLAHFEQAGDWTGKRIIDRLITLCAVVEVQGRNLRE